MQLPNVDFSLDSFAKINLYLDVLKRLDNGYHEIITVFSQIDLSDSLKFTLTNANSVNFLTDKRDLMNDSNLVVRVAQELKKRYKVTKGINIELEKRIPIAAGLGGGSSNAATTIVALNTLWQLDMSEDEINAFAGEFGSDINFFLYGGTAKGTHRGEIIESVPYINIEHLLLVNPNFGISSKEAYGAVTEINPIHQEDRLIETQKAEYCYNKLEEKMLISYPVLKQIKDKLIQQGAEKALLSGSGPTMIGIYPNKESLENAYSIISQEGLLCYKAKTIKESLL